MATQTSSPKRERAPHLGPERRRPQVLDAARSLALREGLGAVTIGALAGELGVTRSVVYACFGDRVELVDALLDRESAVLSAALLQALYQPTADEPEQAFVNGFQALLAAVAEAPDSWRLLLSGEPDPAVSSRFQAARAAMRDKATAWIAPAMRSWWQTHDLDRKLPVLMELFVSSCEAAIRSLLADGPSWTTAELGDFFGRAVFRALKDA